jgi:hypothetical protein
MPGKSSVAALSLLVLLRQTHAQEVIIGREEKPPLPKAEIASPVASPAETHGDKALTAKSAKSQPADKKPGSNSSVIKDVQKAEHAAPAVAKQQSSNSQLLKVGPVTPLSKPAVAPDKPSDTLSKAPMASAAPSKSEAEAVQSKPLNVPRPKRLTWVPGPAPENHNRAAVTVPPAPNHFDTAFTKLADGFDFPVGRPDAQGYYKARGFRSRGHLGEDWDGIGGGNTDLGDPIYSIGFRTRLSHGMGQRHDRPA